MGFEDPKARGRKRSVAEQEASKPPAKRPALAADSSAGPEHQERVRSNVRSLFNSYNALISRAGNALDKGAFQSLLKASTGEVPNREPLRAPGSDLMAAECLDVDGACCR